MCQYLSKHSAKYTNNTIKTGFFVFGLPENYNLQQIDPALLTLQEFLKIINPSGKEHPDSAYDVDVKRMNQYSPSKSEWPRLLQNYRYNGINFEIRLRISKIGKRIKRDTDGNLLRINGELQYFTEEECKRLGWRLYEYDIAIFDGDVKVGSLQDEWNCALIMVASEYRGFGLGKLLSKFRFKIEPGKNSGGFTPDGYAMTVKTYREFVRDALRNGVYSSLVRQKKMTVERVKEIVQSAKINNRSPVRPQVNLNANDPNDWLLYVGEYGDFILYDKKLKDLLNDNTFDRSFTDKMIKGMVFVEGDRYLHLAAFGGDTPKIKQFLMSCALTYCRRERKDLWLEPNETQSVDPAIGKVDPNVSVVVGFKSQKVTPLGAIIYSKLGMTELSFRRSFDSYDEFKNEMIEMAYSKYQHLSEGRLVETVAGDEYEFDVPVDALREMFDPFENPPWWGIDKIHPSEITTALQKNYLDSNPHQPNIMDPPTKEYHIRRIAYLVKHPANDAIYIIPNGRGGYEIDDGYHRLAAAIYRGDDTIKMAFGGDKNDFMDWLSY